MLGVTLGLTFFVRRPSMAQRLCMLAFRCCRTLLDLHLLLCLRPGLLAMFRQKPAILPGKNGSLSLDLSFLLWDLVFSVNRLSLTSLLKPVSGLLSLLDDMTSHSLQTILPLIAGVGIGMLFHAPYQVFAGALDSSTLAVGTSAFFLVRFTGATVGLVRPFTEFN